jgi:outer membrane protein OmpA-like peptidoglycan-associated protein
MTIFFALVFSICALFMNPVQAQFKDSGFEVGLLGGTAYDNSTDVKDSQPGLQGRILVAGPLLPFAQWEIGGGYSELRSRDSYTVMTPADLILRLSPGGMPGFFPYIFGGGGMLYYRYDKFPVGSVFEERNGWVPYVPVGAGAQLRVSEGTQLEVRATYNQMFSPDVSPAATRADDDSYFGVLAGVRFKAGGGNSNADTDEDGLPNRLEKSLGTDPKNADSDGDSLSDGEEYNTYKTNPLNRDTDGDGLGDGAEVHIYDTDPNKKDTDGDGLTDYEEIVQYKTNPLKSDTDADGLSDKSEISEYKTDPNKYDTDGDGLSDGDEVNKYKTDPLKMDTDGGTVPDGLEVERGTNPLLASDDVVKVAKDSDGDGLTDEDEINKYHTNPNKMDTDGGTIADGLEVERGTNPLDPKDDMPPTPAPQVLVFEMDKPVVLPGIQFEFAKAVIKPESESILIQAYNSLNDHKEIVVEISGHADAIGSDEANRLLSERRAESVRQWMINKGIEANRLTSVGYGESRPVASNDTEEGRALNRRIEFKRIK